ncbi:zinc-dependent alcohol dehydrogenase [Salinibacterium soli]|uniref:Zinc-binding dehydrogenase n=1 Tax=Antiquaquibacter soli TaxID=3064523 RepID=A0ABT9BPR4_9MICO|nr:zinc-binding dehydrogenase [Protaetiibacter sp. WY-16]MDO7882428.1 zinc-binding dehydrogenase [Protaetiibacter sp. WY-16]
MPRMVSFTSVRVAEVVDEESKPLAPDEVRIGTLYSGISAGTELTAYRGTNAYMNKKWDEKQRLFVDGSTSFEYPVNGWGYEEVGEVTEIGSDVTKLAVGDVVWGTWGHRTETIQKEERAAKRVLQPGTDARVGIFSQIGAIALNVVLDGDIHVGETVVVFGLGVPGQLVAQLARLNGARVIGVDGVASRRELALRLGADLVLDPADGPVAERVRELTDGRGADVVLEVTGNYHALHEAIRTVAYNSRVCVAGFMQGEGIGLRLGDEFHHNRVQLVCAQISGVNPSIDHRWDEYRLQRTFIDLAVAGKVNVTDLISHEMPLEQGGEAFAMLDTATSDVLQVVLDAKAGS